MKKFISSVVLTVLFSSGPFAVGGTLQVGSGNTGSGDTTAIVFASGGDPLTLSPQGKGVETPPQDAIPEPASAALIGLGVLGLLARRPRRGNQA